MRDACVLSRACTIVGAGFVCSAHCLRSSVKHLGGIAVWVIYLTSLFACLSCPCWSVFQMLQGAAPTADACRDLVYLEAVLLETLRWASFCVFDCMLRLPPGSVLLMFSCVWMLF